MRHFGLLRFGLSDFGLCELSLRDPRHACATDAYVRVAVGLDYLGAAPVRGSRYGGGTEALDVSVRVDQVGRQTQGQWQR